MNRSLLLGSSLIASFLLASSIAFVPYFSANNVVHAQETENQGEVKHYKYYAEIRIKYFNLDIRILLNYTFILKNIHII